MSLKGPHYDTLYFGWEGEKFVLLVMREGNIAHRISLNTESAWFVRDAIDKNDRGLLRDEQRGAFRYDYHKQIDTP